MGRMATKITKATAAQWKKIESIKQKWISQQNRQIPFDEALRSVATMWKAMSKDAPLVLQVPGPIALAIVYQVISYSQLNSQLDSQLNSQLGNQLSSQLNRQLYNQLNSQLNSQLDRQLYNQLDSQLRNQLNRQLYNQLRNQLRNQLYNQLRNQLRNQLDSQLYNQLRSQLYLSQWWGTYAGWYEGGKELGVKYDDDKYQLFQDWSAACPLVWPGEKIVLVCQNPIAVYWEGQLLHNENGPSIEYADGFKCWTIDGIPVDEQIVMRPETQTPEQILKDDNADRISIRANRFGWPRLLKEIKAKELDSRRNEIEGTIEALYQSPMGNHLVVTCPTGRIFALGTPSEVKTCEAASQWLNPHARNFKSRVIART